MLKMNAMKDFKSLKRVVEVNDVSFLSNRNHRYGWLRRHYKHFRLRRSLRKAKEIIARDQKVADEIVRYYFVSRDRITLRQTPKSPR